jgi:hypothetical protein
MVQWRVLVAFYIESNRVRSGNFVEPFLHQEKGRCENFEQKY